ncbi:hypothetical protein GCM10027514_01260 [Azotobacter armeniacus]
MSREFSRFDKLYLREPAWSRLVLVVGPQQRVEEAVPAQRLAVAGPCRNMTRGTEWRHTAEGTVKPEPAR